jgi:2-amino-4-hydroxy-6-hydroxymethyldihydropteridine diphosphokinase
MKQAKFIYIGLGSNIGDKEKNLKAAIEKISSRDGINLEKVSSFIVTKPVGELAQPDFLNAVVKAKSDLKADDILRITQGIEQEMGRRRAVKNGPRIIDLDILLYGEEIIDSDHLRVPHPRMFERDFVLRPLFEIEPSLKETVEKMRVKAGHV